MYYISVARKLTILELGPKRFELSYFNVSYLFWEHKDSVSQGESCKGGPVEERVYKMTSQYSKFEYSFPKTEI